GLCVGACRPLTRVRIFSAIIWPPPTSTLFPYTTLFRSRTRTFQRMPMCGDGGQRGRCGASRLPHRGHGATAPTSRTSRSRPRVRSEEHTSELQSRENLVCRLLLEKKKKTDKTDQTIKHR